LAQAGRYEEWREVASTIEDYRGWAKALKDLASALAQAGGYEEAQEVASAIEDDDRYQRAEALRELASALTQAGRYEEAREVASTIEDDSKRAGALRDLASALAQAGRFNYALAVLDLRKLDEFLQALAKWAPSFERVEPGLSVVVLWEATGIVGWVRSDWRTIHELLNS
jgi:thioredoxin-like negative regulator of GroEL